MLAWYLYDHEVADMRRQIELFAYDINAAVEEELDKRLIIATTLAATTAVRDGDIRRFYDNAKRATEGSNNWVMLTQEDTHLVNTFRPFSSEPIVHAYNGLPLAVDEPKVLYVPLGPLSGAPMITVFAPIPEMAPKRLNVGVCFKAAVMQSLVTRKPAPFNASVVIVNSEQIIMARSRNPERWFGKPAPPSLKHRVLSIGSGFGEGTSLEGAKSLVFLSPRNAYGWSTGIALPYEEITASAVRASDKALTAAAALLICGLLIALCATKALNKTVTALRSSAIDLGQNRVPAILDSGVVEVDAVSEALHVAGVQAREVNTMLERRVAEAIRNAEEAQSSLLHSQKLELIGRLTAGVAHDFNNVLQTVTTALHVIKTRHHDADLVDRTLVAAVRATAQARDLIKQLMTLGRVQRLEPEVVDVADVLLKSHELIAKSLGAQISVVVTLEPGLAPIYVDPVQFEMALLNIVFNARDAMSSGGQLTIEAHQSSPEDKWAAGDGEFVRIDFADNGPGMPEDIVARAFDPYFTTKPVGSGTGIGLAQVQSFARQSGGGSVLNSVVGQGTRVTLFLPIATKQTAVKADPQRVATTALGLNILLVEDDPLVSSVVAAALESHDYQVHICWTADDALNILQGEQPIDLLLTDAFLPGTMTGTDLIKWCQTHRPSLPVVMASGYSQDLEKNLSVKILQKPFEMAALLSALQDAYQGRQRS